MLSGKAPGLDRLSMAFYKAYQIRLVQDLVILFEEIARDGQMPPTMCEALLVTLLKPARHTTLLGDTLAELPDMLPLTYLLQATSLQKAVVTVYAYSQEIQGLKSPRHAMNGRRS
ncbi:hypothetical protein NDU88_009207 [Pleurodeles waltl]|uniref:Uncharacterized protein n=1 Tax=Pleurodeles waltl TaxID=8319 RepID=A0AAV7RWZ3_PLEWA|nr:hypothetical protein NDU88_009207 [Pleurodeles waltl]